MWLFYLIMYKHLNNKIFYVQWVGAILISLLVPFYSVNTDFCFILNSIKNNLFFYFLNSFIPIIIIYILKYFAYTPFRTHRRFLVIYSTTLFFFIYLSSQLILWKIFFTSPLQDTDIIILASKNIIISSLITTFLIFALYVLTTKLRNHFCTNGNILVIGAGWAGQEFAKTYYEKKSTGFKIIGFVDDNKNLQNKNIKISNNINIPVINTSKNLTKTCQNYNVDVIVLAITNDRSDTLLREIYECRKQNIIIEEMATVIENIYYKIPVHHIGKSSFSFDGELKIEPASVIITRIYNIIFAFLGLIFFSLCLLPWVYFLLTKTLKSSSIIFKQERIGLFDKKFKILKLKTMIDGIPAPKKEGLNWAVKDDPRIPKFCLLLRKLKIDEFPQLINVIKGDMNIVGPRPQMLELVQTFEAKIPYYSRRHLVRPGLTGWAQVNCSALSSCDDVLNALQYDLYYVKHRSLYLDILIILKTFKIIIKKEVS